MKSLGRLCSGPKYGSSSCVRAPKNSISLPPSNLPDCAQAPPPFGHRAHRRAAGAGADHHDVRARMVRHQEAGAERADHLHLVADLQVAQVVAGHAAHRLALVVLEHALDRQRQVVVAGPLAVARAGDRVLARVVRPAAARRRPAARCRSTGLRAPGRASRRSRARCGACRSSVPTSVTRTLPTTVAVSLRGCLRAVQVGVGVRGRPGRQRRAVGARC